MRHFDLSPLYRSTIGFDRIFSLLDQATGPEGTAYPPYNIERSDENTYRITVAVAGFSEPELSIEVKEATLKEIILHLKVLIHMLKVVLQQLEVLHHTQKVNTQ